MTLDKISARLPFLWPGAVVLCAVVALSVAGRGGQPLPVEATVTFADSVDGVTVHVSGAVRNPGLVEVALGARIADAVAAAGGTFGDADLGTINLASPLRDGEQVHVPLVGESAVDPAGGATGIVHLNTASLAELQQIPGVGPVLASRIIAERDANGGFATLEGMLDVAGIGEAKLAAMRDYVAVP